MLQGFLTAQKRGRVSTSAHTGEANDLSFLWSLWLPNYKRGDTVISYFLLSLQIVCIFLVFGWRTRS